MRFDDILKANDYCRRLGWTSWHIVREGDRYRVENLEGSEMTIKEYQMNARRTIPPEIDANWKEKLMNGVMGLCGESGEVIDIVKKWRFQGHELDVGKLIDEMGDVCWYLSETADALGVTIEEVMQRNVDKLRRRYPKGFEAERSVNRET